MFYILLSHFVNYLSFFIFYYIFYHFFPFLNHVLSPCFRGVRRVVGRHYGCGLNFRFSFSNWVCSATNTRGKCSSSPSSSSPPSALDSRTPPYSPMYRNFGWKVRTDYSLLTHFIRLIRVSGNTMQQ